MNAFPFSMKAETVPLRTDDEGVVRIGKTRITLDVVISAFHQGATPEEIVYRYPTLDLADVYAVLYQSLDCGSPYFWHPFDVSALVSWEDRVWASRAWVSRKFTCIGDRCYDQ